MILKAGQNTKLSHGRKWGVKNQQRSASVIDHHERILEIRIQLIKDNKDQFQAIIIITD